MTLKSQHQITRHFSWKIYSFQNKKEQIKKLERNDTIGHNKTIQDHIKYIQEEIILTKKNSEDFHQKEKRNQQTHRKLVSSRKTQRTEPRLKGQRKLMKNKAKVTVRTRDKFFHKHIG